MAITVDCFGLTDRGKVRRLNEDQFLIADLAKSMKVVQTSLPEEDHRRKFCTHQGKVFVVADGMGGAAGGEVASGVAVETVTDYILNTLPWFFRAQDGREQELEVELKHAIEECQRKVGKIAAHPDLRGMGTTLTMAYLLWPKLYVVHAGDSRCYLIRGGVCHLITHDHTIAQQMVDRGVMRKEEAESSKWSNALWNCIGGGSDQITSDVYRATLQPGDTLLLCSDGLSKFVEEAAIVKTLAEQPSAEAACRSLIDAANAAGGSDNITVIIARLVPVNSSSDTAVDSARFLPAL
jgi:serine/threonine protein phosphatase PrpC